MLADVRNGSGLPASRLAKASIQSVSLAACRKTPAPNIRPWLKQWDGDGHAHSHHTLRQLLDYDWAQTTNLPRLVRYRDLLVVVTRGDTAVSPKDYCGGVSGGGVIHLSDDEAKALADQFSALRGYDDRQAFIKGSVRAGGQRYALAKWYPPYYNAAGSFISETIHGSEHRQGHRRARRSAHRFLLRQLIPHPGAPAPILERSTHACHLN